MAGLLPVTSECYNVIMNVPLNGDLEITDETRITSSIPTIEYLCKKGAKVLACSHLGRPMMARRRSSP